MFERSFDINLNIDNFSPENRSMAMLHGQAYTIIEPQHEISNNVVCATSKTSDQPAHMCSLIRAFASRLNILGVLSY